MKQKPDQPMDSDRPPHEEHETYDVFISHSSADTDVAQRLANEVRSRGLKPWLVEWYLKPDRNWKDQIRTAIESSQSCVVLFSGSSSPAKPWISTELSAIAEKTWKEPAFAVIPVQIEPKAELPPFFRQWTALQINRDKDVSPASERIAQIVRGSSEQQASGTIAKQFRAATERVAELENLIKKQKLGD
jgi:hypothetical protein